VVDAEANIREVLRRPWHVIGRGAIVFVLVRWIALAHLARELGGRRRSRTPVMFVLFKGLDRAVAG
jgi:hypothetical protein